MIGKEKYDIEVPADDILLEEFQTKIFEVTGVPSSSQKLIFKGKGPAQLLPYMYYSNITGRTLQDESKTLRELRIGRNSKMLLLSKRVRCPDIASHLHSWLGVIIANS